MNAQTAVVVRATNLGKTYAGPGPLETHALRGVTFAIERGEMVALRGPSGCGKSTLMSLLACADRPTTGRIFLGRSAVEGLTARDLRTVRRRTIGVVFQSFHLLDALTVRENVALPLVLLKRKRGEIAERVSSTLALVGLTAKASAYPSKLSGGQAQRVAIARALVHEPEIVLADEPTGNLDTKTGDDIVALLRDVANAGQTILIATHADGVARACDRTLTLADGAIVEGATV